MAVLGTLDSYGGGVVEKGGGERVYTHFPRVYTHTSESVSGDPNIQLLLAWRHPHPPDQMSPLGSWGPYPL